jgi:hypothetical protein
VDDVIAHQAGGEPTESRTDPTVWKWISGILSAILLAGAPGYLYLYLNTPTASEFHRVQENQQNVLQRLAVLEEQQSVNTMNIANLLIQIDQLQQNGR